MRLPSSPPPQIICIGHPVRHQTTKKNIGVKKFLPPLTTLSKARVTRLFFFFSLKKSFLRETDFLRIQDIPWQTLPTPITRSQLTWQLFPPWVQNPSAKQVP